MTKLNIIFSNFVINNFLNLEKFYSAKNLSTNIKATKETEIKYLKGQP